MKVKERKSESGKERKTGKGTDLGRGVTVNCVGVLLLRPAVIHLGLVGLGLQRAVSKESTARQTLPPVKTFSRNVSNGEYFFRNLNGNILNERKVFLSHFVAKGTGVSVAVSQFEGCK